MRTVTIGLLAVLWTAGAAFPAWGAEGEVSRVSGNQQEEPLAGLKRENELLREKLRQLEAKPSLTSEALTLKNYRRLQEIARDVKSQRQTMIEFEGFVTWMSTNLSGYAKYIQAGSVAAGFARVLPIPYAGQASMMTKFVSQGVLSLNAASVAIARYLDTSQKFVVRVEAIDAAPRARSAEIAAASRFAGEQLLTDMSDVQAKLTTTAEISSSALAFMESVNHYVGSADEYWNKTKSLLKRTEADRKEKSFLSESTENLRKAAAGFNGRLKLFEETARRDEPLIKSLGAYDELIRELEQAQGARVETTARSVDISPTAMSGTP